MIPTGVIVLETRGQRTGPTHRTPIFATIVADGVLAGTIRGLRAQWIKNARSAPSVRYWLSGQAHEARAVIVAPGEWRADTQGLPPLLCWVATCLYAAATTLGAAFAILVPEPAGPAFPSVPT